MTKCTIDAMDALNLRALANELRRLDRERFYASIQKALANVCDPYAEVLLSGFLASANKFYRKVREIASPEACAKLRKKLFLLHAPNIFFVALMLLIYYSGVKRMSLYSKMRERFFLAMRIHAMFYGWYSTHAATSVIFESANATVRNSLSAAITLLWIHRRRRHGCNHQLDAQRATDVGRHRENFTHRLTSRHRGVVAMHHGRNDRDTRIGRLPSRAYLPFPCFGRKNALGKAYGWRIRIKYARRKRERCSPSAVWPTTPPAKKNATVTRNTKKAD